MILLLRSVLSMKNWSSQVILKIWCGIASHRPGYDYTVYSVIQIIAIGLYRENAIAVRVIDRLAYDATSRVHAHRQRKNLSYLRNGCCIYYLCPTGSAHL